MRQDPSHQISSKALIIWRIDGVLDTLTYLLFPIGYLIAVYFLNWSLWIVSFFIVPIVIYSFLSIFILPKIRLRNFRYEILADEIYIKKGIFVISKSLIPMARIQFVDTVQGPLLKKYGLASVSFSTGATVHVIPALPAELAFNLRDRISSLAMDADINE